VILLHPILQNLHESQISQAGVMPLACDHTFSPCEGRKER
jgi:hypothetical protein